MKVKIIEHTPNPENVVANAARLCYSSSDIDGLFEKYTDEQNANMIDRLMNVGHESPTEHISFTFGIEGVSRSLTHQLVRHRIGSYSQQSQRYVKEDQFEYITPKSIHHSIVGEYDAYMHDVQRLYDKITTTYIFRNIIDNHYEWLREFELLHLGNSHIIECNAKDENDYYDMQSAVAEFKSAYPKVYSQYEKQAIEDARYVLPNAAETKIVTTMSARSLMNFFKLRTCNRAQWEIRELADKMLIECKKIAPNLFKYSGASCMFGKCPEGNMTCGKPRKVEEYE